MMAMIAGGLAACGGGQPAAGPTAVSEAPLSAACVNYNAWRNTPEIKAALEKASLWPAVIAEGEKAAAGQPFDTAAMQQDFAQMEKLAKQLRETNLSEEEREPVQLAGKAMGLTSRLAGGLATGTLDQQGASDAVGAAKEAIAAYQEDAAKREADCRTGQ
jgi:hypothetical protein